MRYSLRYDLSRSNNMLLQQVQAEVELPSITEADEEMLDELFARLTSLGGEDSDEGQAFLARIFEMTRIFDAAQQA